MHWARFEWVLFDVGGLGFLVWQLVSVRRLIKQDRQAAKDREEK
jgi:hypothetical protein